MKAGFTTGSCAAAASKAAALMFFFGGQKSEITVITPKNVPYTATIYDIKKEEDGISCAVKKDGGDDPDVTTGLLIYSKVSAIKEDTDEIKVVIQGGPGVGRVTKPGLDQPVGNHAINSVPRKMIEKEIRQVSESADFVGTVYVTIWVPGGEEVAKKTFNPNLGIEGGISIIGTSGVVEPMSTKALIDTIHVQMKQKKALGYKGIVVTPGNYGQDFLKKTYGYNSDDSVKCSNFIGETVDYACELGFDVMVLTGHLGKLIKIAGGIMNTHSREADCRMEIMAASAIKCGVDAYVAKKILTCLTVEEAMEHVKEAGVFKPVMDFILERILYHINKRAAGEIEIQCVIFSSDEGLINKSEGADKWLTLLAPGVEQ